MAKQNQRPLLIVKSLMFLAQAMVGIFLPFFIMKALSLDPWEVLLWGAFCMGTIGLLIYPINRLCVNTIGVLGSIRMGLLLDIIFLWSITQSFSSAVMFSAVTGSFVLSVVVFWPCFNALMAHSTQEGGKGRFAGNAQAVIVGSNLIAPVITGLLFQIGLENYALYAALFMVAGSIGGTFFLKDPEYTVKPFRSSTWPMLTHIFFGKRWGGFMCDAIQTATMWIGWGLYFQFAVASYAIMGTITSIGSIIEVVTNKWCGQKTDQGIKKALLRGMWARCVDLSWRVVYLFSRPLPLVATMHLLGNVLGPLFQVPFMARLFEIAEENKESTLTFYIAREIHLGLFRCLWLLGMAGIVYLFGVMAIGWILVLAGISSFWVSRF